MRYGVRFGGTNFKVFDELYKYLKNTLELFRK